MQKMIVGIFQIKFKKGSCKPLSPHTHHNLSSDCVQSVHVNRYHHTHIITSALTVYNLFMCKLHVRPLFREESLFRKEKEENGRA